MNEDGTQAPRGGRTGWVVALMALAFAAGLIGSPWFEQAVRGFLPASLRSVQGAGADGRQAERFNALEARLSALEQAASGIATEPDTALAARVAALEASARVDDTGGNGGPVSVATALPEAATGRLAALEARIAALDQASTGTAVLLDRIKNDLAALTAQTSQTAALAQGARGLVLVSQLRNQALAGRPLDAALIDAAATLPAAAPSDVERLRAAGRIATLAELQRAFAALEPGLASGTSEDSWYSRALAEVRNLVTVQSKDGTSSTAADAAGLAGRRVRAGDINGAIQVLGKVSANASSPVAGWLDKARERQAVLAALARIENAGVTAALPPAPAQP